MPQYKRAPFSGIDQVLSVYTCPEQTSLSHLTDRLLLVFARFIMSIRCQRASVTAGTRAARISAAVRPILGLMIISVMKDYITKLANLVL